MSTTDNSTTNDTTTMTDSLTMTDTTSNSMDERINNITIAINAIQSNIIAGTMTEQTANILRNMLIRILDNAELVNDSINFTESFLTLNALYVSSVSKISTAFTISSASTTSSTDATNANAIISNA